MTSTHSRGASGGGGRSLGAAIFSSWVTFGVSALTALVMTPVLVERLGSAGYGLWSLYMSLTGYFALLDFGISPAVVRYTSAYAARGELNTLRRLLGSALTLFSLAAAGLLAIVAAAALGYAWIFPDLSGKVSLDAGRLTFVLVSLDFALSLPCAVFQGVLLGLQRWVLSNALGLAVRLLRFALVLALVGRGDEGLVQVAWIFTLTGILRSLGLFGLASQVLGWTPLPGKLERPVVIELLSYSVPAFVLACSLRVISYTDALVIGYQLGVESITPFALAVSLVDYVQELGWGLTGVLVPVVSGLEAQGQAEPIRTRFLEFTRYSVWLMIGVSGAAWVCAEPFFALWVGPAASESPRLLGYLLAAMAIYVLMMPGQAVLKGMGRHQWLAVLFGVEALLNLGLSLWWAKQWGLVGVALGTLVPRALVGGFGLLLHVVKVLELPLRRWLKEGLLPGLLPALAVFLWALGARSWLDGRVLGWPSLFLLGGCCALLSLFAVLGLGLRGVERASLAKALRARVLR